MGYTKEQIEQFKADDKARNTLAKAALNDPASIERMEIAFAGVSARILSYSPRNQMLLFTQAAKLGIAVTDVDTRRGWRERGRELRPEWDDPAKGLRITVPRGREDRKDKDAKGKEQTTKPAEAKGRVDDDAENVMFRMRTVYALEQTQPVEFTDADRVDGTPEAVASAPRHVLDAVRAQQADEDRLLRSQAAADDLAGGDDVVVEVLSA